MMELLFGEQFEPMKGQRMTFSDSDRALKSVALAAIRDGQASMVLTKTPNRLEYVHGYYTDRGIVLRHVVRARATRDSLWKWNTRSAVFSSETELLDKASPDGSLGLKDLRNMEAE